MPTTKALVPIQSYLTYARPIRPTVLGLDPYAKGSLKEVAFTVLPFEGQGGAYGPNGRRVAPSKEAEFVDIYA